MTSSPIKIAGAPISWGVSEVAGWGVQLPPERVLAEMAELGLTATENGADGFLPEAPAEKAAVLRRYGMASVGSFVPVVLHDADVDPMPRIERELDDYAATGGDTLIVCAVTGVDGYDAARPVLDDEGWARLFANLDRIASAAAARGVKTALHPHAGSMVEQADEVQRVLDDSSIAFCFDTGHLLIGGFDPVEFARDHADRVAHVHLKDLSVAELDRVRTGEQTYMEGCGGALYTPLGEGDIDIPSIVASLHAAGYDGWFVLEQDKVLHEVPAPGEGPIADSRKSVEYLRRVAAAIEAQATGA